MEGLQFLLKAPSKKLVDEIFIQTFKYRHGRSVPAVLLSSLVTALTLSEKEAEQLVRSARYLIHIAVYENSSNLGPLFPQSFHKDLKALIVQIVDAHLPDWREEAARSQLSLPKLVEYDWRVDIKRAADSISNMSTPTVLVQLQLDTPLETVTPKGPTSEPRSVTFELNKQTLDTMIDGLGKIKAQLSSLK